MNIKKKLEKLATERNTPCVTISLNTHRTHPDSAQDVVLLKNLLKEAKERVLQEFGKREVTQLLEHLVTIETEVEVNYQLESLHIYVSNDTKELIKSTWPLTQNGVYISNRFNVRSLMKSYNRSQEYYILLLSQSGVHLYNTINDTIIEEVENDDFPISQNSHINSNPERVSDSKRLDDLVREYLNKVDKAVVRAHSQTGQSCVVICTEDNFSRLMQVADKPSIYVGYSSIDYNNTETHSIVKPAWELINELQHKKRTKAIEEIKESVALGTVVTDLQEIFQASFDGRGDVLIVHQDFSQPVRMRGERNFELVDDISGDDVIDDITSDIAWSVLSKGGRVFFTAQDEIKDLGSIVLKTRY